MSFPVQGTRVRRARPASVAIVLGCCLANAAQGSLSRAGAREDGAGAEQTQEGETAKYVEVMVTAVAGQDVYLDKGQRAGLAINDVVLLEPRSSPSVSAIVFSVARDGSRARLNSATAEVDVGTTGFVRVPWKRLLPRAAAGEGAEETGGVDGESGTKREPPEHPDWTEAPEEWNSDIPLLAPAHARSAEEREVRIRGRLYTNLDVTQDQVSGDNSYRTLLSGVDLEATNLFGRGGRLQLDFAYLERQADLADGSQDDDASFRPGRFSYRTGGLRGQPDSWEFGRFLHGEFPELGLIDGVEHLSRLSSGNRWGASAGFLPELSDDLQSGDDLAAAVFYRYVSDETERLTLGGALQKSWHRGASDRDLLIASVSARPDRSTSIYATAFVDYYTAGDELKSASFELTQLNLNANWVAPAGYGFSTFASQVRFPDIEREEFQGLTPVQIKEDFVRRLGLGAWVNSSPRTRLNARVDGWEDQDDTGGNASIRMTLNEVLFDDGAVSVEFFTSEGKFSSTLGARVAAHRRTNIGQVRLSWDVSDNERNDFTGNTESLLQHNLRLSLDTTLWERWNVSVFSDSRFGDEQDSLSLGIYIQRNL